MKTDRMSRRELIVGAATSAALATLGGALTACSEGSASSPRSTTTARPPTTRQGWDQFSALDGTALAELVRTREVAPRELLEAAIEHAQAVDPELNAIIHEYPEEARGRADDIDLNAPFAGVPFLLKDIGAEISGQHQTAGNQALKDIDHRSTSTSELGRRFLEAGLVPFGRTNVPEMGMQGTTQPLAFGPTRNPWDPTRSTSGSSGGSAAAVAAGLVPMAHGNDGSGSIRVPAAWCGVVGLKPTRGRTPSFLADHRRPVDFALTRTVRDTARLLDAVQGSVAGDRYPAPPPARPYHMEPGSDPGRLRVALCTEVPGLAIDPEIVDAVGQVGRTLEGLGHHLEGDARPRQLVEPVGDQVQFAALGGMVAAAMDIVQHALGRPLTEEDVEPFFWYLVQNSAYSEDALIAAEESEQVWVDRVVTWWGESGADVLVVPTVRTPALTLEELEVDPTDPLASLLQTGTLMALTAPFNLTGEPAISLPLATTPAGLPIGIQLVAPAGGEAVLLQLAAQLEEAMPWRDRRPSM